MTAIGAGTYKSMLTEDLFSSQAQDNVEQVVPSEEVTEPMPEQVTE